MTRGSDALGDAYAKLGWATKLYDDMQRTFADFAMRGGGDDRPFGKRAAAREPLAAGMAIAHRCTATALVERAREELRASGARPRSVVRTGIEALTASEFRAARLAADGMTKREIAQHLFVTQKTVETQLRAACRKLDIPGRGELAAALAT